MNVDQWWGSMHLPSLQLYISSSSVRPSVLQTQLHKFFWKLSSSLLAPNRKIKVMEMKRDKISSCFLILLVFIVIVYSTPPVQGRKNHGNKKASAPGLAPPCGGYPTESNILDRWWLCLNTNWLHQCCYPSYQLWPWPRYKVNRYFVKKTWTQEN